MKRITWIVVLIAVTIAGSVLAFRLIHRRHGSQQPASRLAQSTQAPRTPVRQASPHAMGAMIVGARSNLTVIRPVSVEQDDYSYLHVYLNGYGEMLFKDGESRLAGFDSKAGKLLSQIANSNYDEGDQIDDDDDDSPPGAPTPSPTPEPTAPSGLADNGFRRLEVGQPAPGTYFLTVLAPSTGTDAKYTLQITFTDRADKMSSAAFQDVAAPPRAVHTYKLQIPSDPAGEIKAELVSPADQH